MTEQTLWEYRVLSVGSWLGTKPEATEDALNQIGLDGWEVVSAVHEPGGMKLFVIAKRPLTETEQRRRRRYPDGGS